MFDIENWVDNLLKDIKAAADKNESFDLHMNSSFVKEVAERYEKVDWIEIY